MSGARTVGQSERRFAVTATGSTGTTINLTLPMLLQIVFLTLKLTDRADWRWLWIFAPAWTSGLVIAVVWLAVVSRKRRA